jgi:uncharacterized protein YcbX
MRLGSIHIYPIKSIGPIDVSAAQVQPWGLAGDRRFMLVDANGDVVTARERRPLLHVTAAIEGDGMLKVTGPHAPPLRLAPSRETPTRPVRVWDDEVAAIDTGDDAAAWFSALLEAPVRCVWLDDPTRRPVHPDFADPDDRVSFADGFPLLLATSASLRRLNEWIAEEAAARGEDAPPPLAMRRFRPSLVIEDVPEPFAEDHWRRVRVGEVTFRSVRGCDRCVLPTIDPETLEGGKEPTRTLAKYRRRDGKVWFAVNLIPDTTGTVHAGDPVTVLE